MADTQSFPIKAIVQHNFSWTCDTVFDEYTLGYGEYIRHK